MIDCASENMSSRRLCPYGKAGLSAGQGRFWARGTLCCRTSGPGSSGSAGDRDMASHSHVGLQENGSRTEAEPACQHGGERGLLWVLRGQLCRNLRSYVSRSRETAIKVKWDLMLEAGTLSSDPQSALSLPSGRWKIILIAAETGAALIWSTVPHWRAAPFAASRACQHNLVVSCSLISASLGDNPSPPGLCSPRRD